MCDHIIQFLMHKLNVMAWLELSVTSIEKYYNLTRN